MSTKQFISIAEEYENDVWFFSDKFNLNRTTFRLLMSFPIVYENVHKLDHDTTSAEDLYMALIPALHSYKPPQVPRTALNACMNRLKKLF